MKSLINTQITDHKLLNLKAFFDEETNTVTYLVWDKISQEAAIIDPVFDFNGLTGASDTHSADVVLEFAEQAGLNIKYVFETHAHADHLSGAPYIKTKTGAKIGIGENINKVQEIFRPIFNQHKQDESDFDILLSPEQPLYLGELPIYILPTPGHTPACVSFKIEDSIFIGDTMFMPDFGTARCDFPGGDAETLFESIQLILSHPKHTKLFMCHDYQTDERKDYAWETTVDEQQKTNIHVNQSIGKADFVKTREARDATLLAPKLLLPSIQVNINAGNLPKTEDNGVSYIKIPIKL
ncbi:MAG: MBL fold metallo-hydrolase [OCS116 cluster bacterium]|uniref:MBL fold metallo-hydrolase n=1 Tax=OCS116 cluster bacterium TaxID=2030921 RepID=A0A2A4YU06_9PROT|nr:MBL fold metallo-hydrolase [OCS116 cluster bacterium]